MTPENYWTKSYDLVNSLFVTRDHGTPFVHDTKFILDTSLTAIIFPTLHKRNLGTAQSRYKFS